jgi:hypothetical protein
MSCSLTTYGALFVWLALRVARLQARKSRTLLLNNWRNGNVSNVSPDPDILPLFPTLLPTVPLELARTLPPLCAVYFVMTDTSRILYIGGTENIRRRWQMMHHRLRHIQVCGGTVLSYYVCPQEAMEQIEHVMIDRFAPPLNAPWRPSGRIRYEKQKNTFSLSKNAMELLASLATKNGVSQDSVLERLIRDGAKRERVRATTAR